MRLMVIQKFLFIVPYAYVDHSSYLADPLFVQNKVTMKFKGEMARDDSPYCIESVLNSEMGLMLSFFDEYSVVLCSFLL